MSKRSSLDVLARHGPPHATIEKETARRLSRPGFKRWGMVVFEMVMSGYANEADLYRAVARRTGWDLKRSQRFANRVFKQAELAIKTALKEEKKRGLGGITPEILEWARQSFNEEEFMAGIREIPKTGGLEFREFIRDLEKAADGDE